MIKEKKLYSVVKRLNAKIGKRLAQRWLAEDFAHGYKLFEHNTRRRMRIKARRLGIKADCHECRMLYRDREGIPEDVLNLDNKGYFPFDGYICRECRWYMRGGMH